jgi:hypothetical protein
MTREKLDALKAIAAERKEKASDVDVIIVALLELPKGQLKKVLSDGVLAVLAKYGYKEVQT